MAKLKTKKESSAAVKISEREEILDAFHILALSVADFYDSLKKARRQFHSSELPDPKWNVMTILEHMGPHTVPHIARLRKLSRQAIQNTVNLLNKDGYVDFIDNPVHKKSPLVKLTGKGISLANEMNVREKEAISKIEIGVRPLEMLKAAHVIQTLRSFFESEQWKAVLEKYKGN